MHALAVLERFSARSLHVGGLLLVVDYYKKGKGLYGFAIVVALHGVIDTLAALTQLTGSEVLLAILEVTALATGLTLLLKLYRKAIEEPEENHSGNQKYKSRFLNYS